MVEIKDKRTYFDLIRDFEYIPFSQSEGWYDYHTCLKPDSIRFFIDNEENPTIALLAHVKRFFGLQMLLIEGESLKSSTSGYSQFTDFFNELQSQDFHIIEINSSLRYNTDYEVLMRKAGYKRPVGLFSTPLSIWINTSQPVNVDRNWKRNISKASDAKLRFEIVDKKHEIVSHFIAAYREMSTLKGFQHAVNKTQLQNLLKHDDFRIFTVTSDDNHILAFRIVYLHHQSCTDVLAANSNKSRECGATHFLLSSLFYYLMQEGINTFDFSRISFSNKALEKVANFKNGAKGKIVQYNGEWSWYKYAFLRPAMYFVKKFMFKRVEV